MHAKLTESAAAEAAQQASEQHTGCCKQQQHASHMYRRYTRPQLMAVYQFYTAAADVAACMPHPTETCVQATDTLGCTKLAA